MILIHEIFIIKPNWLAPFIITYWNWVCSGQFMVSLRYCNISINYFLPLKIPLIWISNALTFYQKVQWIWTVEEHCLWPQTAMQWLQLYNDIHVLGHFTKETCIHVSSPNLWAYVVFLCCAHHTTYHADGLFPVWIVCKIMPRKKYITP